ncbi:lipopolysaccharide heptosyltransferase II [Leptolyngbya sp. FACHB-261]|uniref:lipopolysaccharide heptosyltransferase II n=1 Tax=Leptolyngbya sp. FACHB-261 TaxID=2692806 RepID=UPI0016845F6C|nr:lipopolysaccharide heptosyltransferase II [Leptolyngbya sp. FACHB-261]MBD2101978.1 lipopolysaccharide heptosyltransferase II [Leptolyngbya sp. FACHB-261]
MTNLHWNQAENVLCVRLDTIGDVLMTTPALRALKVSRANRRLTLLTSPAGVEAAALVPELDNVLVYDAPWMKATAPRADSQPEYGMAERLRQEVFDAAVIFTVYSQNPLPSAFLCYLANIPLRLAHCPENPYQLLTDWVLDPEPAHSLRHEVRRQLDLVATVGCQSPDERLALQVPELATGRVLNRLAELEIDLKRPWIVIHPGATALSRRYPPESFAEVARQLVLELGEQILLTGTEPERELIEGIQQGIGVASHALIGCLNLAELSALIALAPLLLSNNTGPVHIAAAVGTPVVDLYALSNPQHTPWQVPNRVLSHDVPCKYCYKSICPEGHYHCLHLLTPETVVAAVRELLQETQRPASVLEIA